MAIYKVYSLPTYPLDHFLALLPSLVDMSSPINCVGTAANFVMHYCLLPVAMECYSDRKEKAHFTNTFLFCTSLNPLPNFNHSFSLSQKPANRNWTLHAIINSTCLES